MVSKAVAGPVIDDAGHMYGLRAGIWTEKFTSGEHSGNLELTYTYVGAYRITVPAGTFDASLFKWHYKGKVGPASIDDAIYRFFAPGVGPVARIELKHISAFIIYSDNEKRGTVLTAHE